MARLFGSAVTVGTGNSGGLFAPVLLVGGLIGLLVAEIFNLDYVPALIAVGMCATLSSSLNVPIAAIVIIIEILGGVLAIPAIIGSWIGYMLTRRLVVYKDIRERMYRKEEGRDYGREWG